jgi:phospholipase C
VTENQPDTADRKRRPVKQMLLLAGLGVLGVVAAACGSHKGDGQVYYPPAGLPKAPVEAAQTSKLDHLAVIVEENHATQQVLGTKSNAPYLKSLAAKGAVAANFYAVTHPSLPNYIAMVAGTTGGIKNDCSPKDGSCSTNVPNVMDELEKAGKSWKLYAEDMPEPCSLKNHESYAVRHNPAVYFDNIRNKPERCNQHVVPLGQLAIDLANNQLPALSFIVPNVDDDMHDGSVNRGDTWLSEHVPQLLDSTAFREQRSALVVTADEDDRNNANQVPFVMVGPAVRPGYVREAPATLFDLTATIEATMGIGNSLLHYDRPAAPLGDMFKAA